MVDCTSHQKMNPTNLVQPVHEEDILDHVSSDQLHLCVPTVMGYSFSRKMWGRFIANKFTTVVWNKTAFDLLVLPRATKELVQSLVHADRSNVNVIKDVISGKGGGCILLLHGKPGTGKTLTAEAVAEEQEKPLLVISIAELGCNAARLEAGLTGILELARLWDAVILLDEADVFLEERGLHELERNAMVGVFLRLLEYHDGIMFLTTNRLEAIDEAFKSRISVAIKYNALDYTARRQIWINFLNLARVRIIPEMSQVDAGTSYLTTAEVDQLASKVLNGRYCTLISTSLACTSAYW
jgi:ATPase family associated with various cellular activities (AAA)